MTTLFLALIGGQLFGLPKEWIAGVGASKAEQHPTEENNGRRSIRLPSGESVLICNLRHLLDNTGAGPRTALKYYLVLHGNDQQIALPMQGKGRWAMVAETAATPLPPAFTGHSRALIPRVIINGHDIIALPERDMLQKIAEGSLHEQADAASLAATIR